MVIVGVTGGIGSGKSVVCGIIRAMGFSVFNADAEAKFVIETDDAVITSLKRIFGEDVYINGKYNRTKVSEIVFSNKELLAKLNSVVHSALKRRFIEWLNMNSSSKVVFFEAAILFESGANMWVDKVVVVTAPEELRIQRVTKRDGLTPGEVKLRINNQLHQGVLVAKSDYTIDNSEGKLIVPQVNTIISELQSI
ncbi:MAG TPA: dephospho-CoA kinase [Tenuifilaceae bacterium]|nr:dephospho-CoA kinase [Tenuifilaceae bacterium]HPJ46005.1 dephospho-CoA kinase [Tenuifilaceae bacterium]HPQ34385.1 dephospho-CoA kinase [Tenuifilaceae bacterium]